MKPLNSLYRYGRAPGETRERRTQMRMTSAEANKMIKQLRDDIAYWKLQEQNNSRFIAATIENIEDVRPSYSYAEVTAKLAACDEKIRKVKHALNVFNSTTVIEGFDMTIDEMLVYLPQLSERQTRLSALMMKPEKERVMNSGRTSIIEYEYANYDYAAVKKDYDEVSELKNRALTALDVTNNTVPFDVEI